MSLTSIEYLSEIARGNVREFAVDTNILLEVFYSLQSQMSLASMLLATMRAKKVNLPSEFISSIAQRCDDRYLELQFALRQISDESSDLFERELGKRNPALQGGKTLVDVVCRHEPQSNTETA